MQRQLGLLCLFTLASAEVMLEISFSLGPKQNYGNYTPGEPIGRILQSTDLKWLRYHVPLVSGQQRELHQNVAHFMFKDYAAFFDFEQEHYKSMKSLHDHFWTKARKTLYEVLVDDHHKQKRSEDFAGGFLWQFHYKIKAEKESQFSSYIKSSRGAFAADLKANKGFLERLLLEDSFIQAEYPFHEQYDFIDLQTMMKSMRGQPATAFFDGMKQFLDGYAVTILVPGPGEGLFWSGAGADPVEDEVVEHD
eukprot:TRINITY_DN12496_c0_g1_i1.p1 TRINITY_DN12496_c0_g1~~TRINITY_DN12496_c0_g1_i1.p1  ORF type:complete len:250 (-),score=48.90 TRINITY_DN12496_c0_g1_i1:18-767(-)